MFISCIRQNYKPYDLVSRANIKTKWNEWWFSIEYFENITSSFLSKKTKKLPFPVIFDKNQNLYIYSFFFFFWSSFMFLNTWFNYMFLFLYSWVDSFLSFSTTFSNILFWQKNWVQYMYTILVLMFRKWLEKIL